MHIILIFPKFSHPFNKLHKHVHLPLPLLQVSAPLVNNGFRVSIIDERVDNNYPQKLESLIDSQLIWIGISAHLGSQLKNGIRISKWIKARYPKIPIVWGGIFASLFPEMLLEDSIADIIVRKEGEATALELTRALKSQSDLAFVAGISFKEGPRVTNNKDRAFIDINQVPWLPYNLLDVKKYFCGNISSDKELCMITSRGCPYRCSFCYSQYYFNNIYRSMSADNVIAGIDRLKYFGADAIRIMDDNFFFDKQRIEDICSKIEEKNIKIKISTTCMLKDFDAISPGYLRKLRKAGFVSLIMGIESLSYPQAKRYFPHKQTDKEKLLFVNEELIKADIIPKYLFLSGLPGESEQDIRESINIIFRLNSANKGKNYFGFNILIPVPGTDMYKECQNRGFKAPQNLREWGEYFSVYNNARSLSWLRYRTAVGLELFKEYCERYLNPGNKRLSVVNRALREILRIIVSFILNTGPLHLTQ